MTTMLEKATDAALKAIIGVEDVQAGEMRDAIRAALQVIRPQQFGDLPEAVCQAAEAAGAGSYHDAHAIITAMIDAILAGEA